MNEAKQFAFAMKQPVKLSESGETGTVVGRSEVMSAADGYLIRYKAADGGLKEAWWPVDALEAA